MIDAICEAIAEQSPFSAAGIRDTYDLCKSFDMVLMAVDLVGKTGQADLRSVVSHLMKLKEQMK